MNDELEERLRATYEEHDAGYDPSQALERLRGLQYARARRGLHRRVYERVRGVTRRTRGLTLVLAGLVVAAPAVGAVSNWFGIGAPEHVAPSSPTQGFGTPLRGTSQLASLRVADPQGGPPWGVRVARTTRGDTCIQVGRVEDGQIGSLGIDHAWHDDRLFHAVPGAAPGYDCVTSDGAGHAFMNVTYGGLPASADTSWNSRGAQGPGCRMAADGEKSTPRCSGGSTRFVFAGLYGPDATSITYQAPDGTLHREKTVGQDGAYLLVFSFDKQACRLYDAPIPPAGYTSCSRNALEQSYGPSGGELGAVRSVTYRDGHTCQVAPTESQVEEWEVVEAEIQVLRGTPAAKKAAAHHLLAVFERQEHISPDVFTRDEKGKSCPRVGYIAPTRKRVTHADVATKIRVRRSVGRHWCSRKGPERPNVFEVRLCSGAVPAGYNRIHLLSKVVHGKVVSLDPLTVLANVSLVAREPVTSSRSWYQYSIHYPRGHGCAGDIGGLSEGDIRVGEPVRFQNYEVVGRCSGVYRGTVSYVQSTAPTSGGSLVGPQPGHGAVSVGSFHFRVP